MSLSCSTFWPILGAVSPSFSFSPSPYPSLYYISSLPPSFAGSNWYCQSFLMRGNLDLSFLICYLCNILIYFLLTLCYDIIMPTKYHLLLCIFELIYGFHREALEGQRKNNKDGYLLEVGVAEVDGNKSKYKICQCLLFIMF